jgi:hypothetical protein
VSRSTKSDIHLDVADTLLKYLSFSILSDGLEEPIEPQHYLLKYASSNLVYHCELASSASSSGEALASRFASFLSSSAGWRWTRRLLDRDDRSVEGLLVCQSVLGNWACNGFTWVYQTLRNFLMITARNRAEAVASLRSAT